MSTKTQENKMLNWARVSGFLIFALMMQIAAADPVDDYNSGLKTFRGGDVVGAMPSLRSAADAGHADAQALLAFILHQAGENEKAAEYFRKSAEQGNIEGQYGLAIMYTAGDGVPKDMNEAKKWFTQAAEQGSAKSIHALAEIYMSGNGVDPNSPEALSWIKRAADTDSISAINALAAAYRTGRYGLDINLDMADRLDARSRKLRGLDDANKKKK